MEALPFECEVFGEMSAFVISPDEKQPIRIPELECIKIEEALDRSCVKLLSNKSQTRNI